MALENAALKDGPRKNTLTPAERRKVVTHMVTQGGLPVQRACQAVGLGRATYYRPVVNWAQRDAPVIEALTTLGATKPRWGSGNTWIGCGIPDHRWNHKRLWRVYRQLRLNLPRRTKKRLRLQAGAAAGRAPATQRRLGVGLHERYAVRRTTMFGRSIILDEGVREVLAHRGGCTSLPAGTVSAGVGAGDGLARPARRRFGSTTGLSSWPTALRAGAQTAGSRSGIFSRASRIRMPSSNGSIGPIDTKCSMPMCSSRWIRCERSVRSGCRSTTRSGPMTPLAGAARDVSGPNHSRSSPLEVSP